MKLVLVLIYSTSKDSHNKTQVELIFYKGGFLYLPTTPDPTRPVSRWHLLAKLSPGWPRTPTTSRTTRWPPPSSTSTSRRVGLLYLVFMFIIKVDFFRRRPKKIATPIFFRPSRSQQQKTFKTFSWCCWFSFRLNYSCHGRLVGRCGFKRSCQSFAIKPFYKFHLLQQILSLDAASHNKPPPPSVSHYNTLLLKTGYTQLLHARTLTHALSLSLSLLLYALHTKEKRERERESEQPENNIWKERERKRERGRQDTGVREGSQLAIFFAGSE